MNKPLSIFAAAAFITAVVGASVHFSSKRKSSKPRSNESRETSWTIELSPRSKKEMQKLTSFERRKVDAILIELELNPYSKQGQTEKLLGKKDVYSKRVDIKNRVVFTIDKSTKTVFVHSVAGHYDRMNGEGLDDIRTQLSESKRILSETQKRLDDIKASNSSIDLRLKESLVNVSRIEGLTRTERLPADTVTSESSFADVSPFIELLNRRTELLTALELQTAWQQQTSDKDRILLIINSINSSKIRRLHDALAKKCTDSNSSTDCGMQDEAWPLFVWALKMYNLTVPSNKKVNIVTFDGKRYDNTIMKSVHSVVSGKVSKTLLPQLPELMSIKALVEVTETN